MNDEPEKVGYCKPPKHTQFQKGKSGNPSGRKARSRGIEEMVEQELKRKISVTENGRSKKITVAQAVARTVVGKALKGDYKSIATIMSIQEQFSMSASPFGDEPITIRLAMTEKEQRARDENGDGSWR